MHRSATASVLVAVSFALLLPCALQANGGGFFRGGVESSGTLGGFEPSHLQAVRIVDEQLTVDLGEAGADVNVRYIMRNETDERVKVRFGFPIEESFNSIVGEEAAAIAKSMAGYRVTAGRKKLKANFLAEGPVTAASDKRFKGIAGWMVSEAVFGPREEMSMAISFRQPFSEGNWGVSDDSTISAKIFRYRLSTGAAWSGPIARGRIELRAKGVDPSEVKILKPANRFRKEGNAWVWEFAGLEPTLADDIEVEAVPQRGHFPRHVDRRTGKRVDGPDEGVAVDWRKRGDRWTMEHRNYRITASSENPPYIMAKIGDGEEDTAWSESVAGPGLGEWIELRPDVPKPLVSLTIRPGFAASDELFAANARPKTVRIELNGGERAFSASIPDRNAEFRIPVSGYVKPVKSVKLMFEDVWKGKKYDDLCVSDVKLEAAVEGKPKVGDPRLIDGEL